MWQPGDRQGSERQEFSSPANPSFLQLHFTSKLLHILVAVSASFASSGCKFKILAPDISTAASGSESGTPSPTYRHYVYVTNTTDNTISVLSWDPNTETLTPVETESLTVPAHSIKVDSRKRFLFLARGDNFNSLRTYSIDPADGTLAAVSGADYDINITRELYVSADGNFLLASMYQEIRGFTIESDGTLTELSAWSPLLTAEMHNIVVTPDERYLYGDNQWASPSFLGFDFNKVTGAVSALGGFPIGSQQAAMDVLAHPSISVVYAAHQNPHHLVTYDYDPSNGSAIVVSDITTNVDWATSLALSSNGSYLYLLDGGWQDIRRLSIHSTTGVPTYIDTVDMTGATTASRLKLDPTGEFLMATGGDAGGGRVWIYRISSTDGTLTEVGTFPVGNGPTSLDFVTFQDP